MAGTGILASGAVEVLLTLSGVADLGFAPEPRKFLLGMLPDFAAAPVRIWLYPAPTL